MAINKNHEFGDLNGIKCAIVEKGISAERVEFLKKLLEYNHYTVIVVSDPPPKATPATVPATVPTEAKTDETANPIPPAIATPAETPKVPETFTLGVTDSTFNATNAIFGRLLKTSDGHIVTQAYWLQKESESHDEVPY